MSTAGFLGSCPGASTAQAFYLVLQSTQVAVNAVQGPGQRKHDQMVRLELDYNPRGAPFESVVVFDQSRQGKQVVA